MVRSIRGGRRPGNPGTRDAILTAARETFAAAGFRGTTIRAVAARADVDPALVLHYFGSKQALFIAAVELPFDPRERFPQVLAGSLDGAGERLIRFFLSVWDGPSAGPLRTIVRTLATEPEAAEVFQRLLVDEGLGPALEALGADRPHLRAALAASQLIGAGFIRYILRIEPLASEPAERLVAIYAPVIQQYVSGDLPAEGAGHDR